MRIKTEITLLILGGGIFACIAGSGSAIYIVRHLNRSEPLPLVKVIPKDDLIMLDRNEWVCTNTILDKNNQPESCGTYKRIGE